MRRLISAFGFLILSITVAQAQQSTGTYNTYISEKPLLSESYSLSSAPGNTIKLEAEATARGVKQKRVTVVSADHPISYSVEANGSTQLSVEFAPPIVNLQLAGAARRELTSKATVVLENLAWPQYIFLLKQYDASRGGIQSFTAFIPSTARDIAVEVELTASSKYNIGRYSVSTNRYRVNIGKVAVDVWTDQANVPVLILIESQGVKVVREGSLHLAEVILSIIREPSENNLFTSEEVTFQNGDVRLAGALTIPKSGTGRFPAAILISGTGTQDRDENPGGYSMFKLIAELLSSNGVAVLRHDDRGFGKSASPSLPTTYRDLINDTKSAIAYLRNRKEIDPDRIVIIGHSEGAETATIIAADDSRIAAIALLAGTSRSLDKIVGEQGLYEAALAGAVDASVEGSLSKTFSDLMKIVNDAKAGKADTSPADGYEYFRQHIASDPLRNIKRVHCPVLILQGERDSNVLAYHAVELAQAAVKAGNRQVKIRIFPNLSHTFIPVSADKNTSKEQQNRVSPEVLETLQKWIAGTVMKNEGGTRN